jgi:TIGR03009 family protein
MPSRFRWRRCIAAVLVLSWTSAAWGEEDAPRPRRALIAPRARQVADEGAARASDEPESERRPRQRPEEEGAERPPVGPFEPLTADEEAELDRVLQAWEERGERVKKLSAAFTRWEYNQAFGKRDENGVLLPNRQSGGELKYFAPDKGLYRTEGDGGEHWVCDGTSIYYYDQAAKQLVESVLPANLQGQRITDGPLPFLFGADAERHRRRYWLRLVTPPEQVEAGYVWIEAWPRFQADAANFRTSTMILTAKDMLPYAMETVLPNDDRTVHQFREVAVNSIWERRFQPPRLPAGWTHVRHDPPANVPVAPQGAPQAGNPPPRRAAR